MSKAYEYVCPCKECNCREVGCHSKCEAFNDWKKSGIEIKKDYFETKKKRRRR